MNRRVRRKVAVKGKGIVVSPSYPETIEGDDDEEELVGGVSHPSSSMVVVIGGDRRTEVDWTALPDDTVIQLFSFLNYRDRASLSSTCRTWRALGSSDCLWESLDLRSHRCDPAMADALSSRCSHLESLRFRGAESADALINFRARNLKDISGDYCRKITDSALSVIAARHEFLECLELGPDFCERISSDAIKAVGICCPRLKRLRLSGLREIDFDAVQTLAANCRNLIDVGFIDCLKVDETALGNVASLRFLSVAGTTNLKWATASQVWITLPNLVGLDVSRTDIGASAVTRLLSSSSKSLRVLCALNCPVLEVEGSSAVRVGQGKALLTIFADVFRGVCSLLEHNTTKEKEVFLNWRSLKNKKGLDEMMTWLEWILSHSLLRIAESNPQGLDEFWITQGAALLLSLMQSSQDDVQEKAASGLATFVVIDDENATIDCKRAEAVMKGGGVRLLLGLATSWREGLQSEAAKALANLSVNTCVAKAVAEDGGITILANLAKSMNRLVAEEAAGGLWNLSVGEEHKGAIAAAGGIKALVDLVFKWSKGGDGVLERAAGALANLAADDRCSMEIAVTGGVHALVMLARNCKFEGVQEQAARALANLAAHGDSNNTNAAVGQESGALEALVELTSSPHEGVRQEAAGALWNLSFDDRNREAIAEARGVEALVLLAQSCSNASPGLQERAAGALWGLSVSETNSIAIGREGGIPPLIALARSEAEDVHETAAGALWNLAFNPGNALRIVEESGVPALIHLSTISKSKMARFMATLALSYMFDGRMDELAHVGTSAEGGAVKCINLESSRRMALKHIGSFILTFSNRQAFAVAASSSAPAALAQVTETARIHEAGHLRCSGAEIGRFIPLSNNSTQITNQSQIQETLEEKMIIFDLFVEIFGKVPVETPKYETIKSTQDYEIRKYPPCVVAQVTYDRSTVKDKDGHGFEILAQYIGAFSNPKNVKNTSPEKIGMTAPVITKESGGERIGMTAPVITKEGGSAEAIGMTAPVVTKEGEGDVMTMEFLLPEKYRSVEEAPKPLDDRVVLREEPEKKYGVVKFSGIVRSMKDKVAVEKIEKLRGWLERDGFRVIGNPILARYNPPWTLPFLRTNEIFVPVE